MSGVEKVGDTHSLGNLLLIYFICLLSVESGEIARKGK